MAITRRKSSVRREQTVDCSEITCSTVIIAASLQGIWLILSTVLNLVMDDNTFYGNKYILNLSYIPLWPLLEIEKTTRGLWVACFLSIIFSAQFIFLACFGSCTRQPNDFLPLFFFDVINTCLAVWRLVYRFSLDLFSENVSHHVTAFVPPVLFFFLSATLLRNYRYVRYRNNLRQAMGSMVRATMMAFMPQTNRQPQIHCTCHCSGKSANYVARELRSRVHSLARKTPRRSSSRRLETPKMQTSCV